MILPSVETIFNVFKCRRDVYAVRWENRHGKSGYSPDCKNIFSGKCIKNTKGGKCSNCTAKEYKPFTVEVIKQHLSGSITAGVYPLLPENSCWWVALDFDNHTSTPGKYPLEDALSFKKKCLEYEIPCYIERSRSGKGAHTWIFFDSPVEAWKARRAAMVLAIESGVMDKADDENSMDRFFPNQDTLSGQGLGNLIALPFSGKSCFVDDRFKEIDDQGSFLKAISYCEESQLDVFKALAASYSIRWGPGSVMESTDKKAGRPPAVAKKLQRVLECDFVKRCQEAAMEISEAQWYAMVTNLIDFEGGEEEIHRISALDPERYDAGQTGSKIVQAMHAVIEYGPHTCKYIDENGFACPKLGQCETNAPAGLAYKPAPAEELVRLVSELPVSSNMTQNAAVIRKFIDEWLFDCDKSIAETLIDNDIKERFGLKGTRSIKEYYHKVLSQNRRRDRQNKNAKIPPWYAVSETGSMRFLPGVLAIHLQENVKSFYAAELFHIYENGVYKGISDDEAAGIVRRYLVDELSSMTGIRDTRDQWKIGILKEVDDINSDPYIINLRNGLLDVNTGELKGHTEQYFSTVQLNIHYNPEAKCDAFFRFIRDTLHDELIPLAQEILGYILIPVTKSQKSFVVVGPPRTGKSTFLWIAESLLLGVRNVSNIPWQELGDRFKTAELFGKLANIFADLPSKAIEDSSIFKVITGEDYLMGERKGKNPFKFKPFARLLFSCNEIPKNYGDRTEAFYRRLIIIPFNKQISPERVDTQLREKLTVEADGIFLWALQGLKRLIANNYRFSEGEMTAHELEKYKVESNSVLMFVQDECVLGQQIGAHRADLYNHYKEYCNDSGLKPLSQIKFNNELEMNFKNVKRCLDPLSRRKCWTGIGLLDDQP